MTDPHPPPAPPASRFRWKWFLVLGIALMILGVIALGSATLLKWTTTLVLGPLLMASGILQVLLALFTGSRRGALPHLMAAALDLVVGLLVVLHPSEGGADLVLVLVLYLMVGGLYRIFGSLLWRAPAWGWALAAGAVPLLLGILLRVQRPFVELWLVGLCVAVDFLCHGTSWIVFSQTMRGAQDEAPGGGTQPADLAPQVSHQPPSTEEGERDYKGLLDQGQQVLQQEAQAIERVDDLIHKAEQKGREIYGGPDQGEKS